MPEKTLNPAIESAVGVFFANLNLDSFQSLTDDVIDRSIANLIDLVNGHAIAIWLYEQKQGTDVLTIAYNVGERGHDVEGFVSTPTDTGLVSKAFKELKTICHQGIFKHKEQSTEIDMELGQVTAHQIASPFRLFDKTIGAITVIQTLATGIEQHSEWGFDKDDILHFETGVAIIQRLFEWNVVRRFTADST